MSIMPLDLRNNLMKFSFFFTEKTSSIPTIKETLLFSIPQLGLMLCHLCISFTDLWVTGKLGVTAQAALGIVAQVNIILMLAASFFCSGFSSTIAQCLGAKKHLRASRYVWSAVFICFFATIFIAILTLLLSHACLNYLNIENIALKQIISIFIIAYSCNLPLFYTMAIINHIFRAYKKMHLPWRSIFIVCTINFIASLGFGMGSFGLPNFSYAGVAWATTLSSLIGFLYNLYALWKSNIISKKSIPNLKWLKLGLPYVFRIGIPSAITSLLLQSGNAIIMLIIISFPYNSDTIIAGYTLGTRMQSIVLFISTSLSVSIGILVGHLMGERNFEVIYKFGMKMILFTFIASTFLSFILYFSSVIVVNYFSSDNEVIKAALYFILFACFAQPFAGINAIIMGLFNGVGASRLNAIINGFTTWGVQIPMAYILGSIIGLGISAVYSAFLLSSIITSILLCILFQKRKWQNFGLIKK